MRVAAVGGPELFRTLRRLVVLTRELLAALSGRGVNEERGLRDLGAEISEAARWQVARERRGGRADPAELALVGLAAEWDTV